MSESTPAFMLSRQLKRAAFMVAAVWTLVVLLGAGWHLRDMYENSIGMARIQALFSFEKDLIYRRWNAGHGGVYVPSTEATPPNPHLSHLQNRDVTTTSGLALTLVNPAYMTRQVHELGREEYGHWGHITSLDPIRPENAADTWETEALKAFEQGETELTELAWMGDAQYLRLMKPLMTEKVCLKCHEKQGYKEGDVRGGISISIPMEPHWMLFRRHLITYGGSYALVWLLGLAGIGVAANRMGQRVRERDRAEQELRESESSLRSVFRAAPVGIGVVSERVLRKVNLRLSEITGYGREELIGRNARMLYPSDEDYEYVGREKYRQIKARGTGIVETRLRRKDGTIIDVLLSSTPIDPVDLAVGVTFTVLDISERKQSERALRQNEARLYTLLETLPDPVWLKDADGVYLACNPKFERFFGAREAEIVGKTDHDFVDKELADFFRDKDKAAMAAGGPRMNEEEITYADAGHREILETIKTPMLDAEGRLIGVLGIGRDITGRKQAEDALAAKLNELRRWYQVTLGREGRILELKREVNALLAKLGRPPHYSSTEGGEEAHD